MLPMEISFVPENRIARQKHENTIQRNKENIYVNLNLQTPGGAAKLDGGSSSIVIGLSPSSGHGRFISDNC
jgi:hypothetical protein